MISNPVLRVVVSSDSFRPITSPNRILPILIIFFLILGFIIIVNTRTQNLHCAGPVFLLTTFILH
ncbi:Uncharacterised protein [Mycobacteroides abscessus subsp. abscessus]|nr:Uncharacterised protein [Mycobacteroides abscessus subsp. abscessus]